MRTLMMIALFAVAAPIRQPVGPQLEPAATSPADQILGDWQDRKNPQYMLRITRGDTVFHVKGNPSLADGLTANIVIDWSKNPATVDFMPKQRGGKMLGILRLDGDQLIVNLRTSGSTRPTDFGAGDLLLHYQRMQK